MDTGKDLTDSAGAAAQQDFFELLERAQSSRLDDQRCVLPAYFEQVRMSSLYNNVSHKIMEHNQSSVPSK